MSHAGLCALKSPHSKCTPCISIFSVSMHISVVLIGMYIDVTLIGLLYLVLQLLCSSTQQVCQWR